MALKPSGTDWKFLLMPGCLVLVFISGSESSAGETEAQRRAAASVPQRAACRAGLGASPWAQGQRFHRALPPRPLRRRRDRAGGVGSGVVLGHWEGQRGCRCLLHCSWRLLGRGCVRKNFVSDMFVVFCRCGVDQFGKLWALVCEIGCMSSSVCGKTGEGRVLQLSRTHSSRAPGASLGGRPRGSEVTGKFCATDFSRLRISPVYSDSDPFENDFVYIRK